MKERIFIFVIAALLVFFAAGCSISIPSASQLPAPAITAGPTRAEAPTPGQTEIPAPTIADIAGVSSDSGYVNDTLGFSMTYPEGYTVLTRDQINTFMTQIIDKIKSTYTDPVLAQQAIDRSVPIAMAFKHPLTYAGGFNANFNLVIYGLPAEVQSPDIMTIATAGILQADGQAPSLKYGEPSSVRIGGKDAATADLTQTVNGIQRQYYLLCDNNIVIITASAGSKDDLAELDDMVLSIQFAQ